jgi:hypothetical protein
MESKLVNKGRFAGPRCTGNANEVSLASFFEEFVQARAAYFTAILHLGKQAR